MTRRLLLVACLLSGCGGSRIDPPDAQVAPVPSAPLASFASVRMIVLPAQGFRASLPEWTSRAGDTRLVLAALDSALATALRERGLASTWAFSSDLARMARRNPTYAADPATIRAGDAARVMERKRDMEIPEPVATQLRTLAGLHDARHALIPVDLRFEAGSAAGTGRAVLHVVVLDVRASRIAFIGDVAGPESAAYAPTFAAELARRFADLIVVR